MALSGPFFQPSGPHSWGENRNETEGHPRTPGRDGSLHLLGTPDSDSPATTKRGHPGVDQGQSGARHPRPQMATSLLVEEVPRHDRDEKNRGQGS
jgi:hypothetical protein